MKQIEKKVDKIVKMIDNEWEYATTGFKKLYIRNLLQDTREEVIEELKKKLPSHKGKMLSRTEVKNMLDKLTKK